MRDLSKIPLRNPARRSFKSKGLPRLILIAVLAIFGFMVISQGINLGRGLGSSSVVLREAQRGLVPVALSGEHEELLESAVDLTTQKAVFEDVKHGGEAQATATRSFGGGSYILSVDATLPDPVNVDYQVWIVGGGEVIPIEYMSGEDTDWSISIRAEEYYANYDGIWITLERTKDDMPEEHVMEGSF